MTLLPPPADLGAPEKFRAWRPGQAEAALRIIDSPQRVIGLVLPTGSGKSLAYLAAVRLVGWTAAVLTATKALQAQLLDDFGAWGLVDIRGQANYQCLALAGDGEFSPLAWRAWHGCDVGPCHVGLACSLKPGGCLYYDAVRQAHASRLLVTNYHYWIARRRFGEPFPRDVLVLDEAHAAPDELASALSCRVTRADLRLLGETPPVAVDEIETWAAWASRIHKDLTNALDTSHGPLSAHELRHRQALKRILGTLEILKDAQPGNWLVGGDGDGWSFDPLWPASYTEPCLTDGAKKVVLSSATLTRKTLSLLGFADADWFEVSSSFPVERRPVYYVPTERVDHRMDADQLARWLTRIDQILRARRDRKGIIHTVSYARRSLLLSSSEFRAHMISHDLATTRQAVETFKAAPPGTILVSPSVTTGYDFPYDTCEYQIVCKIPFPDSRSPLIRARTADDSTYPAYLAMQQIVQAAGRGMRAADDQCECFIVDDHWRWFAGKFRSFAPAWFWQAVREVRTIPPPPPPLAAQASGVKVQRRNVEPKLHKIGESSNG